VRAAGPLVGAGVLTWGLVAVSLLADAPAGEEALPARISVFDRARPDPVTAGMGAPSPGALKPASTAPPSPATRPSTTVAPTTAPTTAVPTQVPTPVPPTGPPTGPSTIATAPPAPVLLVSSDPPPGSMEQAQPATWSGVLPTGAVSVGDAAPVPVGIRVDALGVEAPIVPVGTTEDQMLELPTDATTVAWFRSGPRPGGSGSAVLAAHVDYAGQPGVFFDLGRLEPGARIDVAFSDGTWRSFATTGPAVLLPKGALPVDDVFRRGGVPVLTLVTCGGPFDHARRSYEDNTIVTAVPV
jgi:sortase (surface protein transpeptidase)